MIYRIYSGGQDVFPYKLLVIFLLIIKQLRMYMVQQRPREVIDFDITQQQFERSQNYQFDKLAFKMYVLSLKAALDILFLLGNLLPLIWETIGKIQFIDYDSEFQRGLAFILVEAFKSKCFDVPIDFYQTFVIEKKYLKIQKTFSQFWFELCVNSALVLISMPPILYGYLLVADYSGEYFYVSMQIFAFGVTLIVSWVFPNIFAPLFSKIKDLQNPYLRHRIQRLAIAIDFPLQHIYILDNSKWKSHSNAHFYGIGSQKRIVLYNSLINNLDVDEVVSVIGHQLGHWKFNHALYKFAYFIFEVFCIFYVFSYFRNNHQIFISFGFNEKSTFIGTALFFSLFEPIRQVFQVISLVMSRYFQFQADQFSCSLGLGRSLLSAMKKIQRDSAAVISDPLFAWCRDSHPSIHERVYRIQKYQRIYSESQPSFRSRSYSNNSSFINSFSSSMRYHNSSMSYRNSGSNRSYNSQSFMSYGKYD